MNGEVEPTKKFSLEIQGDFAPTGQFLFRSINEYNTGIEKEVILAIVRTWLRAEEDRYYSEFTSKQS